MPSLWKQENPLHPSFERFHRCLADDWFLLPYELRLQRAHARALTRAGILDQGELHALDAALDDIEQTFGPLPQAPDDPAEDLHTFVEAELTKRAGDAGKKIHTGRSRNDQVATLLQLYLVDRGGQLAVRLAGLVRRIAERAVEWAPIEMPLQTHAQFAAPGSAGAWALRYAFSFERDRRALAHLVSTWREECALGAGAVAGSSVPIDRHLQASLLGFDGPAPSALDATSRRDETLALLAWATQLGLHVQSFATDTIAFMQTPFSWLRPMDGLMTGSSMMPNKSNPDGLELMRGVANALHGAHVEAVTLLKGLPSGYNRDLQCLKPLLRDSVERVEGLVALVDQTVRMMEFDPQALQQALTVGNIHATLRMERDVLAGRALRDAHHAEAGRADQAATDSDGLGAGNYATIGSASPAETLAAAGRLLERLPAVPA